MNELDEHYRLLLHHGLCILREAILTNDKEWMRAEVEMLHNLPSLLGETNTKRHEYYWYQERTTYIQWVNDSDNETAKSRMHVFYEGIWSEMEPIILGVSS